MDSNIDDLVSACRNRLGQQLQDARGFVNPQEGQSVLASKVLKHLNLDRPGINAVLREAHPYLEVVPGLKQDVHARVKAWAWITLKGHNQVAPGWRALKQDVDAQHDLGFSGGNLPHYDTMRELVYKRLSGRLHDQLLQAILVDALRCCPNMGENQGQDATPLEARRREQDAPFNPHYLVRMHKADFRWDLDRDALLTQQIYHGLAHEGVWLPEFTDRLAHVGLHPQNAALTVDNGYVSFEHIAHQWRLNQPLRFRRLPGWVVDAEKSRQDLLKRYQKHWRHPQFQPDARLEAKLRFLVDYGTPQDVEAVGRHLRDRDLTTQTPSNTNGVRAARARTEALNGEFKRLPITPARRGTRELVRRYQACTLAMHLVQLTRLQNGVNNGLCLTANIV